MPRGVRTDLRARILEPLVPFLRGEISQSDFDDGFEDVRDDDSWTAPFDVGLDSLCELIWLCYSDFSNQTIWVERPTYEFLRRSAAWLQTDLEWNPPRKRTWWLIFPSEMPAVYFDDGFSPFTSSEVWTQHRQLLEALDLPNEQPPVRRIVPPGSGKEFKLAPNDKSFRLIK